MRSIDYEGIASSWERWQEYADGPREEFDRLPISARVDLLRELYGEEDEPCDPPDVPCECGALTGEACDWKGPPYETTVVEYVPPESRRGLARNDFRKAPKISVRCHDDCAQGIVEAEDGWAQMPDAPEPWYPTHRVYPPGFAADKADSWTVRYTEGPAYTLQEWLTEGKADLELRGGRRWYFQGNRFAGRVVTLDNCDHRDTDDPDETDERGGQLQYPYTATCRICGEPVHVARRGGG